MRYQLTTHNGRCRSFLSKWYTTYDWLEYSPIVDKMYCFVCRCFAHRVVGSVGHIDAAFTSSGTQAKRWKNARSALSKHQSSSIHKQAALCWVDFVSLKPISQQLSKEAEASASRQKCVKKGIGRFYIGSLMLSSYLLKQVIHFVDIVKEVSRVYFLKSLVFCQSMIQF